MRTAGGRAEHTYYLIAGDTPVLVHNSNCPTTGILEIGDERIPLVSGSPRLPNYQASGHVEGQAALIMRERGITNAVLHIDNPNGICLYCTRQVRTLLPERSALDVGAPLGTVIPNKWWGPSRIFTGNSRNPSPWPR